MKTKTSIALSLFRSGDLRGAFSLFSCFRIGFTSDETRTIQIASESLKGNVGFYKSIGIDTDGEVRKAKEIIKAKYFQTEIE